MKRDQIHALVQETLATWEAPGAAVAVVKEGETIYMEGAGVRELGKPEPVTPDTLFAIASTTKAFTCTAIAMLVDEGKMQWDDPVRKYIPHFRLSDPLADTYVTLRDLATHRTGYSRHDFLWYNSYISREEMLQRFESAARNTTLRSQYEYNNVMYGAAGFAAGNAVGMSWEELIRTRIFEPLGMTGANLRVAEAQEAPDHASPHYRNLDGQTFMVPWCNLDCVAPGGGINAGVRDLANWLHFLLGRGVFNGKSLLSPERLEETWESQIVVPREKKVVERELYTKFSTYGLGWRIWDYRGMKVVSHGGALDGFRSHLTLVPERNLGMVALVNQAPSLLPDALRNSLLDYELGLPSEAWNQRMKNWLAEDLAEEQKKTEERDANRHRETQPSHPLGEYVGEYVNAVYGRAVISEEAGALRLQWQHLNNTLHHYHYDTFQLLVDYPVYNQLLTFATNKKGKVSSLNLVDLEFVRA